MLKNISRLECQVAGKTYQLLCDMDSPLEHVRVALEQFNKYVDEVEKQALEQAESKEQQL